MPHSTHTVTLRTSIGSGIAIDREAGIIRNIAVLTAGVTKPSGDGRDPFDVDAVTLQQVADAINASAIGIKSRMTHPELDELDELPLRLGYVRNARVDGGSVRADMHFHDATSTQAITLMDIAEHDPASCGLSVADFDAALERDDIAQTGIVLRVNTIDAVDWVGTPAGNPAGMLSVARRNTGIHLQEQSTMNEKQIEFLRSNGLPFDATSEQTVQFIEAMSDEHKAQFNALRDPEEVEQAVEAAEAEGASGGGEEVAAASDEEEEEDQTASGMTATAQRTQADIDHAVMLAQKRERVRQKEIRTIALRCGYDETWIEKHVDAGTPIGEVRRVALAHLQREPENMPTNQVTVGADLNRDSLDQAVQDAIMLRAGHRQFVRFDEGGGVCLSAQGPETRQPHDRSNEFRGHSLVEMGRRYLVALGYHAADKMNRTQVATLLMSRVKLQGVLPGVFLAHSTGDFPFLLADAMGKSLRGEYALAPHTWNLWARQVTAPDFKEQKAIQLSEAADLEAIPEGDEYTYAALTESREVWKLVKYGRGLKFTREMLINDDLSAFDRVPRMMGRAAARRVEQLGIGVLTDNAQMADSNALFSTAHANLATGAIDRTSLGAARALLRRQTALGSDDPLELTPRFLLVPETISTEAETFIASSQVFEKGDTDAEFGTHNPFANRLQVIPSARLDLDSTEQWYLLASPEEIDTVEVGFLEGEEAPVVEEEDEFDSDVRKVKVRHQIAAKAIDWRGMVRSSGT